MTLTYRDQLNRDLTPAEVDANFRHVLDSANSTFLPSGTGAVALTVSAVLEALRNLLLYTDENPAASIQGGLCIVEYY